MNGMKRIPTRCLVTGSTGYIGGRLVPALLGRGFRVRVLVRNPDKLAGAPWRDDVEIVRGDLTDRSSLDAAFTGVDVAYHLVHAMGTAGDFVEAERRGAHNVADAARSAGTGRIVYLGGGRCRLRVIRDDPPPHQPATGDDDAEMGAQQDPADFGARCAALPGPSGDRPFRGLA